MKVGLLRGITNQKIVEVDVDGSMTIRDLKEKLRNTKEVKSILKDWSDIWKEKTGKRYECSFELIHPRQNFFARDDTKLSEYFWGEDKYYNEFYFLPRMGKEIPEEEDNENGNKLNDSGDYASYYGI